MKLSVAMCTYNGAKYIREQLDSILSQRLPVDEIVICDDGSTDDTHNIIRQYVERYPDVIRFYINEKNKGFCRNFDYAMRLCTGDLIFFSDQDDVWYENKTLVISGYFEKHRDIAVVFTNAHLIDDNSNRRTVHPRTLFESFTFNGMAKSFFHLGLEFDVILKSYRATGATMGMRRSFVPSVAIDFSANIKNGKPIHDAMIALCAINAHKLGYISECIMGYRCHDGQQASANLTRIYSNNVILPYYASLDVISEVVCLPEGLKHKCEFLSSRIDDKNNPEQVVRKTLRYWNHYKFLSPIVFGFDLSKALYRHYIKGK